MYEETQSLDTKRFRVVGIFDGYADDYHFYITDLLREEILPCDIAIPYRCRWEVELLFRELKTRYALGEFNTTKKHVIEIFAYAALLTLLVSRELLDSLSGHAADDAVFPSERWAATRSHAQLILHELSQYLGYTPPPLIDWMAEDGQKIHRERAILQERLATVTQQEIVN